ncbi:MAG: hypothetical protein WBM40_03080, partial [Thiohalocapsa sp.]
DIPAIPHEKLPLNDTRAFFVTLYGMDTWGSLYNPRQALAMATFARHVRDVREEVEEANSDLGEQAEEFSRAISTYLGFIVTLKLLVIIFH